MPVLLVLAPLYGLFSGIAVKNTHFCKQWRHFPGFGHEKFASKRGGFSNG